MPWDNPNEILPASHETTKTLLALTKVSKSVSPFASKYLWRHCAKISSPRKARDFNAALASLRPDDARRPTRLFIGLYQGPDRLDSVQEQFPWPDMNSKRGNASSQYNTALAQVVGSLLVHAAPTLKRLVLSMPLEKLSSMGQGQALLDVLRTGFESLVNLEEFVTVQDSFYFQALHPGRPEVWASSWPNLRRLCLDNPPALSFAPMARLPKLDTLVLTRKKIFQAALIGNLPENLVATLKRERGRALKANKKPFTLILVDECSRQWTYLHPHEKVRIILIDTGNEQHAVKPVDGTCAPHHWIKQRALKAVLWDADAYGDGDWNNTGDLRGGDLKPWPI